MMAALYAWCQGKAIWQVDADLADALVRSGMSGDIPVEVLSTPTSAPAHRLHYGLFGAHGWCWLGLSGSAPMGQAKNRSRIIWSAQSCLSRGISA